MFSPCSLQCVRKKCAFFIIQAAYLNNVRHLESWRVRDILPFLPTFIYKYYSSNNEEDIQQMKKTKGSCSAALWQRQSQHGVPMMDHTPRSVLSAELSKWMSMEIRNAFQMLHALENAQQWDTEWSAVKELTHAERLAFSNLVPSQHDSLTLWLIPCDACQLTACICLESRLCNYADSVIPVSVLPPPQLSDGLN